MRFNEELRAYWRSRRSLSAGLRAIKNADSSDSEGEFSMIGTNDEVTQPCDRCTRSWMTVVISKNEQMKDGLAEENGRLVVVMVGNIVRCCLCVSLQLPAFLFFLLHCSTRAGAHQSTFNLRLLQFFLKSFHRFNAVAFPRLHQCCSFFGSFACYRSYCFRLPASKLTYLIQLLSLRLSTPRLCVSNTANSCQTHLPAILQPETICFYLFVVNVDGVATTAMVPFKPPTIAIPASHYPVPICPRKKRPP